jgi:fermentation-respiration switch protein FrsA (DUF1100 family)
VRRLVIQARAALGATALGAMAARKPERGALAARAASTGAAKVAERAAVILVSACRPPDASQRANRQLGCPAAHRPCPCVDSNDRPKDCLLYRLTRHAR